LRARNAGRTAPDGIGCATLVHLTKTGGGVAPETQLRRLQSARLRERAAARLAGLRAEVRDIGQAMVILNAVVRDHQLTLTYA
jgi:hypothetical protein